MKDWKSILLLAVGLACIAITNCSMLDNIVPVNLPQASLKYLDIDPNEVGFPSLQKAKDILNDMVLVHYERAMGFKRLLEDENYEYGFCKGLLEPAIREGEAWKALIIGDEDQPFSILGILSYLGIGAGALFLGKEKLVGHNQFSREQHDTDVEKAKEEGAREVVEKVSKETLN